MVTVALALVAYFAITGVGGLFGGGRGPLGGNKDVVATVGDMKISRGELDAAWETQVQMLSDQGVRSTLQLAKRRGELFQSLVSDRVTLAIAKDLGVDVSDKDVQKQIDDFVVAQMKVQRGRIMGKISAAEEKIDPRYDREFATALSKGNSSVRMIEDSIRAQIPEDSVRSRLAQQGIQSKIKQRIGPVTAADVNNSYNVYSVRQIVIPKASMPQDQLKTRVDKIVSEAKAGKDFAALAKEYSQDKGAGGAQTISYDQVLSMWMMTMRGGAQFVPYVKSLLDIWDQVSKIKPGEIGAPMDTDQAVYILKVEKAEPKLPAKFDKKTQDQRKAMIEGMRSWQEGLKIEQQVRKNLDIKVIDPEFRGYWELAQLSSAMSDPAKMKAQLRLAKAAFTKAIAENPSNDYATAMLSVVLAQMGDSKQAIVQLYHLLEGPNSRGDGADLRIMLGDLLWQSSKDYTSAKNPGKAAEARDEAIKQYVKASERAPLDEGPHQELIAKFKDVGRPDLAAKEQQWLADWQAKKKILEANRAKNGAPAGPAQGGPQGAP